MLLAVAGFLSACSGDGGEDQSGQAKPRPPAPGLTNPTVGPGGSPCDGATGTLQVAPAEINFGGSATVTWSVTKPAECTFPIVVAGQTVAASGSLTVKPLGSTTYLLAIMAPKQKNLGIADVRVKLPSTVDIRGSSPEMRDLLIQAVGTENTAVRLWPDVNIDLSYRENLPIARGVTLTTESCVPSRRPVPGKIETCVRDKSDGGPPGAVTPQLGPRLFTTTKPRPLFIIRCYPPEIDARVRLYGFRLHGPHPEIADGDANLERGIMVRGCRGVELANLEVANWSGQAIYVVDDDSNNIANPADIWIHDNFLHHNQHVGGNGYGVDVATGAYALIERNVFDFNRHAIAASGQPNTGYEARYNLVLKGGGVHGKFYNPNTHQFDVHGTKSCGIGHLNCGNAGERFWYRYNSFQFTRDNAIKIRGTPQYPTGKIEIDSNVFAHDDLEGGDVGNGAINLNDGRERITIGKNNVTDRDTYGIYGVCDFDGDGRDDLFQPTGVTWWYSSAGKMRWIFLRDANERLDKLGFGDFDGDGRCDVFTASGGKFFFASGGRGEWKPLGDYGVPFDQLAFGNFIAEPAGATPITEIFRRAPNGEWSVASPGKPGWQTLGSSGFPLKDLRFADFTGDGITDVLGINGGKWAISESGTKPWAPWGPLSTKLSGVWVADVDANGKADVLRLDLQLPNIVWEVSWDGRTEWRQLAKIPFPLPSKPGPIRIYGFVGRFDDGPGADPLFLDDSRMGRLHSRTKETLEVHNLFPY